MIRSRARCITHACLQGKCRRLGPRSRLCWPIGARPFTSPPPVLGEWAVAATAAPPRPRAPLISCSSQARTLSPRQSLAGHSVVGSRKSIESLPNRIGVIPAARVISLTGQAAAYCWVRSLVHAATTHRVAGTLSALADVYDHLVSKWWCRCCGRNR
jgi:hypothetical protein